VTEVPTMRHWKLLGTGPRVTRCGTKSDTVCDHGLHGVGPGVTRYVTKGYMVWDQE
jgi:hypothetical protein